MGEIVDLKPSYEHQGLLDNVLKDSTATQDQLAEATGYSRTKVAKILSTDEFTQRLATALEGRINDGTLPETLNGKLEALMARALDVLFKKFDREPDYIGEQFALKTLQACVGALGIGSQNAPSGVNINMVVHLEELGNNLTQLLKRRKLEHFVEGEISEKIQAQG